MIMTESGTSAGQAGISTAASEPEPSSAGPATSRITV